MATFKCPVDQAIVSIPKQWAEDPHPAYTADVLKGMFFAYHIRKEHGREALEEVLHSLSYEGPFRERWFL